MKQLLFFILFLSHACVSMEDSGKKTVFIYTQDILPHMPRYTKITPEKGTSILAQLIGMNFDKEQPKWKFKHAFDWARANLENPGKQVDLGILKRFIAMHIDKSEQNELNSIKEQIIENPDELKWVVVGDVGSAVSDARILQRWQQFIEELILYAPVGELLSNKK